MVKFPESTVYRSKRRRTFRGSISIIILLLMMFSAWYLNEWANNNRPVVIDTTSPARKAEKIVVKDGDSFDVGTARLRLDGIDAPELHQNCTDAAGQVWQCGRSARAALERLLTEPGLICQAGAHDRYARALANCRTSQTPDIAAKLVREGMAMSGEFFGSRSFGYEEDEAQAAKRGIWASTFETPSAWRSSHPRTNGS